MARPKKTSKVEVKEESLSEVLSPSYTLEPVQDLTVIGPDPIPEIEVKFGLIKFVRSIKGFDDLVHCHVNINGAYRQSESSYHTEDIQDAYALGVKVDALIEYKKSADRYELEWDISKLRKINSQLTEDFSRFQNELRKQNLHCRMKFDINNVLISFHAQDQYPATFEVR